MSPRIQAIIAKFVGDLTVAIQEDAAAAFKAAIGGELGDLRATRGSGARSAPAQRASGRGKGAKRDPGELEALTTKLATYIKRNPGQRIEQIGQELGITTKELVLPVRKLIAAKRVSTKGQKRATTYYAK